MPPCHDVAPRRPLVTVLLLSLAACAGAGAPNGGSAGPVMEIQAARGSDAERATADALRRLVATHDVSRWIFTPRVVIDERSIPHSHPVLTLHTRHLGDDDQLLATFLHEQLHWLAVERREATDAAKAEFRSLFPDPPSRQDGGASDAESTWLHLVVNDLTYQALTRLMGREEARRIVRESTVYSWVNATVLDDPRVREVTARQGLRVP